MRWPFGPPHLTLKPSKKNQKNKNKTKPKETKKKTNKEGLGPSEVALRATSHDPYFLQKETQKKTKQKKEKKQEKTKNTQKWAFQLSVKIFFFLGWVSKISLFWQLGPTSAHPKNTIKIGVSGPFFGKQMCVTKRPFLDQKTKIRKFQLSF